MHDVIIRGAEICDGSGEPPRVGDIAISDGRIAAVGAMSGSARRTIDADGLVAAPGFIDVHTHYDCQVSWDPALTPSSWHGVTSVVMGNCGFSIAPCRAAHRDLLMEMLLYVEGMPTEAPGKPDPSRVTAQGYFLVDAFVGWRWRFLEASLAVQNLFNSQWREAQFGNASCTRDEVNNPMNPNFAGGGGMFGDGTPVNRCGYKPGDMAWNATRSGVIDVHYTPGVPINLQLTLKAYF